MITLIGYLFAIAMKSFSIMNNETKEHHVLNLNRLMEERKAQKLNLLIIVLYLDERFQLLAKSIS